MGIDLGTTKIIVYRRGKGIVLEEPSVVAYNIRNDQVVAVGHEALAMLGKTPAYIQTECPIRDGVISNHLYTEYLVKEFVRKVTRSFLIKPRIAICIPSSITPVEARAVVEAAMSAGARKVYLVDEPLAAAIGAGIDVTAPSGHMMVDAGGGTTDVAVISLGGVVTADSLRVAGNTFDEAIIKYIQSAYKMAIGSKVAEKLKKEIGCVFDPDPAVTATVKGRNLLTGCPQRAGAHPAGAHRRHPRQRHCHDRRHRPAPGPGPADPGGYRRGHPGSGRCGALRGHRHGPLL